MNTISKMMIFGGVFIIGLGAWLALEVNRSANVTNVGIARAQPIQFSHQHHVAGLGIECRYCHTSVENSSFANVPPTSTCMNCHQQIWFGSQMLEPVRASWKSGKPIEWTRVHNLGDYVFFNHGVHVQKGIGCVSCHGRVDKMQLVYKSEPMTMEWCLSCHRAPEKHIRPKDKVFDMEWRPEDQKKPETQAEIGARLVKEYNIEPARNLSSCSTCHH
jgi:hypothetical protein